MKRSSTVIALLCALLCGCSVGVSPELSSDNTGAGTMAFRFKKGLWPGTYHLVINNMDTKRAVEFHGCFSASPEEAKYYVMMKDGSRFAFDSEAFYHIGAKGRYAVLPGQHGSIPFKLEAEQIAAASRIIFKGVTYAPRMEGHTLHQDEMKELVITYDVLQQRTTYEHGEKVSPYSFAGEAFLNMSQPDAGADLLESHNRDDFRLIGSERRHPPLFNSK